MDSSPSFYLLMGFLKSNSVYLDHLKPGELLFCRCVRHDVNQRLTPLQNEVARCVRKSEAILVVTSTPISSLCEVVRKLVWVLVSIHFYRRCGGPYNQFHRQGCCVRGEQVAVFNQIQ